MAPLSEQYMVQKTAARHRNNDWKNKWREWMAYGYLVMCIFDFVIAPIFNAVLIAFFHAQLPAWQSLTLSNGGIVHLAFGAILGVSAWGKTREITNGPFGSSSSTFEEDTKVPVVPVVNIPIPIATNANTGGTV